MAQVSLKSLIDRLNPYCIEKLQAAAGMSVTMTHYEVTVEHFVAKLNESADADLACVFRKFGLDQGALARALDKELERFSRGNAARPVMSPRLIDLLHDAWMIASIELGERSVRSGAVVLALLGMSDAAFASKPFEYLRGIGREALLTGFRNTTGRSSEEAGAVADAAADAAAPGETGAGGGDGPLSKYCIDFCAKARLGQIDPVFGRDREIRQMIDILARRRKNNPIVVGDAGVGKTAVVEGLALRIVEGDVPDLLQDVRILALDLGLLEAGAGVRGEFENRLKSVIEAVKASARPIILFIDEAHVLIGAGNSAGGGDAANLLKPVLARGELRTIAATTWSEYKKYFEKDAALSRRFQPVKLDEPSIEDTATILRGLKARYEEDHGVLVREDAIMAAASLSDRYVSGRQLPDKAVDLLDTAASRVKVNLTNKPDALEDRERRMQDLTRRIEALDRDRRNGLDVDAATLDAARAEMALLGEEAATLADRWKAEREAVEKLLAARAELAAAPEGEDAAPREALAACVRALETVQGDDPLVRYEVDPDMVAKVVSDWTGIPLGKVLRDEAMSILRLEDDLKKRIKGQDAALRIVARHITSSKSGLEDPSLPQGVFLLVGPSGVGKTETALALSDLLFGDERAMISINMSEFQERHTVSRLIGSPPGYVGYGEGGVLTEAVRQRPYSVVLLDEVEKADLEVMNLFYQVFDKGMLADGEGRVIDFKNTIFFLTSNLASDRITRMTADGGGAGSAPGMAEADMEAVGQAIRPELAAHFKPALLGRMTVVPYAALASSALRDIVGLKLDRLGRRIHTNNGVRLDYAPEVVERIAARCTEVATGARSIDHILRGTVMPRIAEEILRRMFDATMPPVVRLDVDEAGELRVGFAEA
ncbi:MAG: type VI secretion system ATPase TssH [Desulfovibrionaceae bacterium]